MLDGVVERFVRESLPPAPARVLEVGAGQGELAMALGAAGYDVVAVDPASRVPHVRALPLHELREPPGSFDAALAVVSLHHVNPLAESCARLAEMVRPGGTLVVDEIDFDRFDERAAQWWLDRREAGPADHADHADDLDPAAMIADLRHHLHALSTVRAALEPHFELGAVTRGPYLYRWELPPGLREAEAQDIAAGRLPATGARFVGTRR